MLERTEFVRARKGPGKGEGPFPEGMVETYGAETAKETITKLFNAGVALQVDRMSYEFEGDEDVPEGYFDITREPGFDVFEAHRLMRELREKRKYTPTGSDGEPVPAEDDEEEEESLPEGSKDSVEVPETEEKVTSG